MNSIPNSNYEYIYICMGCVSNICYKYKSISTSVYSIVCSHV